MAERDRGRLADARRRLNVSPLGSGALAGAGYPLDREATAAELGFDGVTANSLDAVGDRDFVVETLAAVALGMVHLSRLAEEIVWWSNPRFGFVRVADAYSTGSSMMPNKRNPDPAELVRGRTAAAIGAVAAIADAAEGPAARLPARPPGGQAAAVRRGRDLEASLAVHGRPGRDARRSIARRWPRRPPRATRPRRPLPTRSSGGACRSAPPTTSSARSWAAPSGTASGCSPTCRRPRSTELLAGVR